MPAKPPEAERDLMDALLVIDSIEDYICENGCFACDADVPREDHTYSCIVRKWLSKRDALEVRQDKRLDKLGV